MRGQILILFSIALIANLNSAKTIPPVNSSIHNLSGAEKTELIAEWVHEADNHHKWSHEARLGFALAAYENANENQNLRYQAMYSVAKLYAAEGSFDIAFAFFDTLINHAVNSNDIKLMISVKNLQGIIYRSKGNYYQGLINTYDALRLTRLYKIDNTLPFTLNNLGLIYHTLNNKLKANELFNQALKIAETLTDSTQIIQSHINLGLLYRADGKLDKAYNSFNTAFELAVNSKDRLHIASIYANIGNIYRDRFEIEKALEYYYNAKEYLSEIANIELKSLLFRNIGIAYQLSGNYTKAIENLSTSLDISKTNELNELTRDNYITLSQLHKQQGNIAEAHALLAEYTATDGRYCIESVVSIIQQHNQRLEDADARANEFHLSYNRKTVLINIIIIALIIKGVFLLLLFWNYKKNKIRLKSLEKTKKENENGEFIQQLSNYDYQKGPKADFKKLDSSVKIVFANAKECPDYDANSNADVAGVEFEKYQLNIEDETILKEKVELIKAGKLDHFELQSRNFKDEVLWISVSSVPFLDMDQKSKGSVILVSNITERKQTEQTYNNVTTNLNQKIMQLNCMYDISDISEVPGITLDEMIEKTIEIIPVGLKYSQELAVQIMYNNKIYSSKNYKETSWSYMVPIKVQKKKLGYIKVLYLNEKPAIGRDAFHFNEKLLIKNISEKLGQVLEAKNMELVLKDSQEKLKQVQKLAKISNWEKDTATNTITYSDTFFEILDVPHEKRRFFDFDKFFEYIHPDDKATVQKFYQNQCKSNSKSTANLNYRIITDNGEIRYIHTISEIIRDDSGAPIRCVNTLQDITEQKVNQELKFNIDVALKTAEAKQQFLANMSHEMRTPMNGIMAMANFILQTKLTKEQLDYAKTIKESSEGLLHILNDILDLSKIEAGKFSIRSHAFYLEALLNRINGLFISLAKNKKLKLKITVDENIPAEIITDENRLYQVIINIVSNAVKFSNSGEIKLDLKLEKQEKNNLTIKVSISDTGPGIKESDMDQLFMPFIQIDNSYAEKNEGTGLGLAISKKLVDLLGGNIGVVNNKGKGCTFYFTFTANRPRTEFAKQQDKNTKEKSNENGFEKLVGLRILCVDDKKVNQKVVSLMLKNAKCDVTLASNGLEALELMDKNVFDVVLMDIVMPLMDGITAMREIKKRFANHPPIIALSANVMEGDKEEYLAEGMNDYISKPINSVELYQKLALWAKYSQQQTTKKSKDE